MTDAYFKDIAQTIRQELTKATQGMLFDDKPGEQVHLIPSC